MSAAATPKEIRTYLKDKIADYKVPRKIEFRDSFPKTATGKIQKLRLRDDFIRYTFSKRAAINDA